MFIYKITCLKNNKIYIGQTTKTIEERFAQHKNAAIKNLLNTHLCNAMKKYGVDNFIIEQIDTANTQEELTEKEYYWINYYETTNPKIGYNETNDKNKCGGNTYGNKSVTEMQLIKNKISKANMGGNNGMSKAVKAKNIKTNDIIHFTSIFECARYFNSVGTSFIRKRCKEYNYLYKDTWLFAFETDDFKEPLYFNASTRKGQRVKITNIQTGEVLEFPSKKKMREFLKISRRDIKDNCVIEGKWKISII